MQTGNTEYNYKNDLDKAGNQHDMAYGKYKDLAKISEYQRGLLHYYASFLIKSQKV